MSQSQSQPPSTRETLYAYFLMGVSALAVAVMVNAPKLAFQGGSNPATVVTIRAIIACLILSVILIVKRQPFKLKGRALVNGMACGVASALMLYSTYVAILYIGVSLTILIVFINPFFLAVYYHYFGASKLTTLRIIAGFIAFGGLALALSVDLSSSDPWGLACAFFGSIMATVMVIFTVRLSSDKGVLTANFHLSFWSLLLFIIVLIVTDDLQFPQTTLGWTGAILSGVSFAFAYLTFFASAAIIGISRVSMISFIEPVLTILLAAVLFQEYLNLLQWGGVLLVAMGLFIMEMPKDFLKRKS